MEKIIHLTKFIEVFLMGINLNRNRFVHQIIEMLCAFASIVCDFHNLFLLLHFDFAVDLTVWFFSFFFFHSKFDFSCRIFCFRFSVSVFCFSVVLCCDYFFVWQKRKFLHCIENIGLQYTFTLNR